MSLLTKRLVNCCSKKGTEFWAKPGDCLSQSSKNCSAHYRSKHSHIFFWDKGLYVNWQFIQCTSVHTEWVVGHHDPLQNYKECDLLRRSLQMRDTHCRGGRRPNKQTNKSFFFSYTEFEKANLLLDFWFLSFHEWLPPTPQNLIFITVTHHTEHGECTLNKVEDAEVSSKTLRWKYRLCFT